MTPTRTGKHVGRAKAPIEEEQTPSAGKGRSLNDWLGLAVFGTGAICTLVWLSVLSRGDSFFYDEWDFINLSAARGYWQSVLQPHNGHPSMIPFSIYEVLLQVVGLRHYGPYQGVLFLLDVGCGALLFVLLRRKIHPIAAGALPALLMLLGPSWQDLLWPFQIGFLGSVAGGLGALVLIDRRTTAADIGACVCLLASIGCSGVGLTFLAGVGVEFLWRRRDWRRLWVPAIPFVLFVVWYEAIGKSTTSSFSASTLARSAASATAVTVGSLIGRGTTVGGIVAAILGVLTVVAVIRSPKRSARLAMAVSGLLAFWILTLVARGIAQATPIRYLYPAAALVLIGVGELPSLIVPTVPAQPAQPWARVVGGVAVAVVVAYVPLAIWWNSDTLNSGGGFLTSTDTRVRAEQGALLFAGSTLPKGYRPDTNLMPQVTVGPLLAAAAQFGSPGDSSDVLKKSSAAARSAIDAMLLGGRPMWVVPTARTSRSWAWAVHAPFDRPERPAADREPPGRRHLCDRASDCRLGHSSQVVVVDIPPDAVSRHHRVRIHEHHHLVDPAHRHSVEGGTHTRPCSGCRGVIRHHLHVTVRRSDQGPRRR